MAPAAPPAIAAPATARRVTRDDVLRLGQAGRPWDFLPVYAQVAEQTAADSTLRLVAAANFARLGLRTAAAETLDGLDADAQERQQAEALRAAIEALPADEITAAERERTCAANIEAARARGVDLSALLEPWKRGLAANQCFRTLDGNIVRRKRDECGRWLRLRDDVGEAARVAGQFAVDAESRESAPPVPPITLEGIDPPFVLLRLMEATPRRYDGYQPRVAVVQADSMEFLDALSWVDLRGALADERLSLFVGAGASQRLAEDLDRRVETTIKGIVITAHGVRTRLSPPTSSVIEAAAARQADEHRRLSAEVKAIYAGRDADFWRKRFEEARAGGPALRVLIPTSRYSTFVKHSAADLAEVMREAGCEARVLMEPDDFSRLASPAYLRAFSEFRPDLVVLINYARAHMGVAIPPEVPFVCWIQDSMGQLFDEAIGAGMTPLDFAAGNVFPTLISQFRYPAERCLPWPVTASARKFDAQPAPAELRQRFECEIAYVSHHSQTPEEFHRRLLAGFRDHPHTVRAVEAMLPRVRDLAHRAGETPVYGGLEAIVREALREAGAPAPNGAVDDRLVTLVLKQAALPLADRFLRHQTLSWAAEIAERAGWRLRVFGRGWETHERFAPFAQPEVEHGEALRACYQAAAAHLHMSINMGVHQRVAECALSGGLPLCRLNFDDLIAAANWSMAQAVSRGPADFCALRTRLEAYWIADQPELLALARVRQRLGLRQGAANRVSPTMRAIMASGALPGEERRLTWLLGDPSETGYLTQNQLAVRLELAVRRPGWRENSSRMIAGCATRLDASSFARRLIDFICRTLGNVDDAEAVRTAASNQPDWITSP